MHVLVTADTVGGVWTYARELVSGLAGRGVQVTLVSFGDIPTLDQTAWMDGLKGLDYRPTAFRLEWMRDAEQDSQASSDYLLSVIEETKPDLLHINQFCYGSLPVSIPRIVVAHSDVVSWWVAVKGEEPPASSWMNWYRKAVAEGLERASAVVAPSRWMLEQIGTHYSKPKQGSVIYNGRSPVLFNPYISKEEYVLTVGRIWDTGKQAALLTQFEPTLPVLIVGAEQHADSTLRSNEIGRAGTPGLRHMGPQNEAHLRQLYARAAIYAATSRYEPFGLAPLEAALSRCAIVANDIPTFHELWGDAACYFRYNDSGSLEQTLKTLQADRELRLAYSNLAYDRARQRFTADRMVADYMNLYQALVPAGVLAA